MKSKNVKSRMFVYYLCLSFFVLCSFKINVYAGEAGENRPQGSVGNESNFDENSHCTSGHLRVNQGGSESYYKADIDLKDGYFCFMEYDDGSQINIYLKVVDSNGVVHVNQWCDSVNCNYIYYRAKEGWNDEYTFTYNNVKDFSLIAMPQGTNWITNIPVFKSSDSDAITRYIEDGDLSGAENAGDLNHKTDTSHYDESVEMPQNLKILSGGAGTSPVDAAFNVVNGNMEFVGLGKLVYTWEQTVDTTDWRFECQLRVSYKDKKGNTHTTPWHSLSAQGDSDGTAYQYKGAKSWVYGLDLVAVSGCISQDNFWERADVFYITSIQFRVCNYNSLRGGSSSKCSAWVTVNSDYSSGKDSTYTTDDSGGTSGDDNVVDSDYNDDYDVNDNQNVQAGNIDLKGILSYIQSGFGLLGNNGLIALMSGLFTYIPASIWSLIKAGIAIAITIMVIALVKNFVFG